MKNNAVFALLLLAMQANASIMGLKTSSKEHPVDIFIHRDFKDESGQTNSIRINAPANGCRAIFLSRDGLFPPAEELKPEKAADGTEVIVVGLWTPKDCAKFAQTQGKETSLEIKDTEIFKNNPGLVEKFRTGKLRLALALQQDDGKEETASHLAFVDPTIAGHEETLVYTYHQKRYFGPPIKGSLEDTARKIFGDRIWPPLQKQLAPPPEAPPPLAGRRKSGAKPPTDTVCAAGQDCKAVHQ